MEGTRLTAHAGAIALSALLALGLSSAPAWAATIVVPNDFPTIQAAVDAASAGDTVLVKKGFGPGPNGEYQEEDLIIDVKDLTLKCAGAVLDGAIPSDAPGGPVDGINFDGIHIDADGVTVDGCTVQNFDGDGIEVDGDGATILNNTLVNNGVNGLKLNGDDFLVRNNTAIHNANYVCRESEEAGFVFGSSDGTVVGNVAIANSNDGFRVECCDSKRVKFLRNRAFRNQGDGFDIHGEDHTLAGNRAETNNNDGYDLDIDKSLMQSNLARGNDSSGFDCVEANCDDNIFRRNVALNNGGRGFRLECGDDNKFIRNLAIGNENEGFQACGDDNEFANNRAIENQADGLRISCDNTDAGPTCGGPFTNNRSIRNIHSDDESAGFDFRNLLKTTVSGNTAIANERDGFRCDSCDDVLFERNTAKRNGFDGFHQEGSADNTYKNNRSIGNDDDGFDIDSTPDRTTLINNDVRRNNEDGIDIDANAEDTTIDGNTVVNNQGTGIENNGRDDTIIKNNTMRGNRTDLAGRGDEHVAGVCSLTAATDGGGNSFATGGFKTCTPCTGRGDGTDC